MPPEQTDIEQAVSRALRDNLDRLQRMADEVHQAVADLVAACASTKAANALPPMLRAQTTAAALSASLDVLAKFVAVALQAVPRPPWAEEKKEPEPVRVIGVEPPAAAPAPVMPPHSIPTPMAQEPAPEVEPAPLTLIPEYLEDYLVPGVQPPVATESLEAANMIDEGGPIAAPEDVGVTVPIGDPAAIMYASTALESEPAPVADQMASFDLLTLPPEEQELHRRANRVAKVSMQDIQMLRPEQVRLGRENKDLCVRLRDDIEKAHREYERRFRPILGHPVDYFYHWMVEILGGGDPDALGEYPYSTPVLRR